MRALATLLVAACWTGPAPSEPALSEPPPAAAPTARSRPPFDRISLERTRCFGTCPAYKVTIFGSGRVEWLGKGYVTELGMRTDRVSPEAVQRIAAKVRAIELERYDAYGHKPIEPQCTRTRTGTSVSVTCNFQSVIVCTDTSHGIIELRRGRSAHRVDNAHCADDSELDELERLIDDVANTARWIGD